MFIKHHIYKFSHEQNFTIALITKYMYTYRHNIAFNTIIDNNNYTKAVNVLLCKNSKRSQ